MSGPATAKRSRVVPAWAVFVEDGGSARARAVEIGERNALEAEVRSGLAEGERVVLHPSDRVEDGVAIRPRD